MADYDSLQGQIQSLKPQHIECREGTLCIAIIPHNRSINDTFAPSDLMWVKCPQSREVKVLLNAYRQKYNPTSEFFHLTHEGVRRDPFDVVESLEDGDNVVVLKAVDGPARTWEEEQAIAPHVSPSKAKPPSTPRASQRTPSSATPYHEWKLHGKTPDELAWMDFCFAHKAIVLRRYGQSGFDADNVSQQWLLMSEETKEMLGNRATTLSVESVYMRRAFWEHWCERLPSNKSVGDSFTDNAFMDHVRSTWADLVPKGNLSKQLRETPGSAEIPPLPVEGRWPTAPAGSSARAGSEDGSFEEEDAEDVKAEIDPLNFAASLQTSEHIAEDFITTKFNINDLFSQSSIAEYEKGVVKGLEILGNLRKALGAALSPDADQWLASIDKLEAQAERTRTVIGVVGATGAGKSSVINAMLDEERVLPTNCMRACTAVVTEISYNFEDELYRAEIEFISPDDKLLHTFHDEVEKRAARNGGSMARFYMLRNQLQAYREVIKDASNRSKVEISTRQKDINREFVPVITLNMLPAYQYCTEERGTGSYKRMKAHMDTYVESTK